MSEDLRKTSRVLRKTVLIPAPLGDVYRAFTTVDGVKSFFAPDARIEPQVGGAYEIYFMLDAPEGARGSEGCHFTLLDASGRIGFTWNFPPSMPLIRNEHTDVAIELAQEGDKTRLVLFQLGWKDGPVWDEGFRYFDRAWGVVLDQLVERFTRGPVDWSKK